MDGALALVSGRPVHELDVFLTPAKLPAAGLHGLERRSASGRVKRLVALTGALDPLRARVSALVEADPRLVMEDKGAAVALHYREAPEREGECRGIAEAAVAEIDGFQVLPGKMVVEVKSCAATKGGAIEAFMSEAPFDGRRPLFAGDDLTDEHGFDVVARLGGISVKVGDGRTRAMYRVADVGALLDWLHELAASLNRKRKGV